MQYVYHMGVHVGTHVVAIQTQQTLDRARWGMAYFCEPESVLLEKLQKK